MRKLIGPFNQILTMEGLPGAGPISDSELRVIHQGGILVDGDKIFQTGSFENLIRENRGILIDEIENHQVVLPGLVDAHTHLCFAGTRSRDYSLRISGIPYEEILSGGGGIYESVENTRKATDEELLSTLEKRAMRHLSEGVTTMEVKSGYGLSAEQEVRLLRIINRAHVRLPADLVPTCLAAHVIPKEFTGEKSYLLYLENELLPVIQDKKLTRRIDIFIEKNAFTASGSLRFLTKAREWGFNIVVHADQFSISGSHLAVQVGAISADHLEASGEEEIRLLAKNYIHTVVLPGASMGLGMPFAQARKMLDEGCRLVIATDWNPGSAPMGDLLLQAAVLSASQKLSTAETLASITFRAAETLGLMDRGIIKNDMKPDFISFNTSDFREILYHQGKLKPTCIWINGNRIH